MSNPVILFLPADPTTAPRLDQEVREIEAELRLAPSRDSLELRSKWVATVDDLMRHLLELQPAVIHFTGHGRAGLTILGDDGKLQRMSPRVLTRILRSAAPETRLVVLNGCFDAELADALVEVVDVAIGTAAAIDDRMARTFAVGFYRALAYGRPVGNAFDQAMATLMGLELDDADFPKLRVRAGVDPRMLRFPASLRSDHAVSRARVAASPTPTALRAAPTARVSPAAPAQVVWLFAHDDETHARELLRRAVVLEEQNLIRNWSVLDVAHGHSISRSLIEHSRGADVVVILTSPALLEDDSWRAVMVAGSRARVVPVLLRSSSLPPELATWTPLPTDGQPVISRRDRDEALSEVIQGLEEVVRLRSIAEPTVRSPATPGIVARDLIIDEIYRTGGPPTVTFVEPPRFGQLRLALRNMGTGLIIEGPSRVGKSTAVRKAMDSLRIAESDQIWLYGQDPPPIDEFKRTLDDLRRGTRDTWLFIDDFHYLESESYRRALAVSMKLLVDQAAPHAKIALIGINPLGSSLMQIMPDLSGRVRIERLDVERDWQRSTKLTELIRLGEGAANIRFKRREEFVLAAAGSFFLAQLLCNFAAKKAGIEETQRDLVEIDLGPADVVTAIQGEMAARYRAPLLEFAAFDAAPPPRGAGLSLLWLLAQGTDGFVPLNEARLRFPTLEPAFTWFLESNLSRFLLEHPGLRGLLYYNRATTTLTMEDPQLKFYLRELDWEKFAEASGHGHVRVHPEDGPIWQPPAVAQSVETSPALVADGGTAIRRLLHLSDLHFSTKQQATVAYAQLAADLRQQGVIDRLDALVVSGDLVNRAEPAEYGAARLFLESLMSEFNLTGRQVVLVPGNHDVSWSLAKASYLLRRRSTKGDSLVPGAFIEHGTDDVIEVRDETKYRKRFQPFIDFYRTIKGDEYPLDYSHQFTLDEPDPRLLILGLNSAWEVDHHFRDRASIQAEALARALMKLGSSVSDQFRIAVFHHPIQSGEDSRIRDAAFLQQLAVHGFRLVLHGHVHRADSSLYRYDRSVDGRQLEIVAAGTFGAPTHEWVHGYPLQYNLLLVGTDKITVETRCWKEVNGAWAPDSLWQQGEGKDPTPRYIIPLRGATSGLRWHALERAWRQRFHCEFIALSRRCPAEAPVSPRGGRGRGASARPAG